MLNKTELSELTKLLLTARQLKEYFRQSNIKMRIDFVPSKGCLKQVSPRTFCKHNNITIKQLKEMAPDYTELQLLIPYTI